MLMSLSSNWQSKKLWDVIILWPQKSQIADIADNIPISFVPMSDLSQEEMLFEVKEIRELWEVRKWYTYFWDNDILLAKVTPCFENGKCGIAKNLENGIWFWSSEFFVLRTKEEILPEYLYYIVSGKSFRGEWAKNMWWAVGLQRVKKEWLLNFRIPLPPLEEQKKIVAYLDELNATISKLKSEYQSQLAMLDEMRNSSLDLAFWGSRERERAYNLNNWKWVKLGGIAKTQSGGTPSRSNPLYRWEGIVRLKSWELEDNDCITKYTETITLLGLENSSAKKFTKGTLLLAMYGATAWKLGILWIDAATNQAVCAIQNTQNKFVEKYIYYFLLKERDKIIRDSFWWAQPNISKTYIDNIELPLPDLETQSQIVAHLDQVHQQITMLKTQVNSQIEHCDELWQSSLEKVLTQGVNNEFN